MKRTGARTAIPADFTAILQNRLPTAVPVSPSPSMSRLPITKTPQVYVGGAFIRSESGRTFPFKDAGCALLGHIPQCTRKDVRNAVEAAAKAGPGWAKRTAYNRGQTLYRLAEMIEARTGELVAALAVGRKETA